MRVPEGEIKVKETIKKKMQNFPELKKHENFHVVNCVWGGDGEVDRR